MPFGTTITTGTRRDLLVVRTSPRCDHKKKHSCGAAEQSKTATFVSAPCCFRMSSEERQKARARKSAQERERERGRARRLKRAVFLKWSAEQLIPLRSLSTVQSFKRPSQRKHYELSHLYRLLTCADTSVSLLQAHHNQKCLIHH